METRRTVDQTAPEARAASGNLGRSERCAISRTMPICVGNGQKVDALLRPIAACDHRLDLRWGVEKKSY